MLKILSHTWLANKLSSHDKMQKYVETNDIKWLEQLVRQHQDQLFGFIAAQSSSDLAADVCQQTWLKVMDKKHLYRQQYQFKAWLFTIARNILLDEFRRKRKYTENSSEIESLATVTLEQDTSNNERVFKDVDIILYTAALNKLNFQQKEALMLQLEGFSLKQISDICGAAEETIKTRIRYAKQNLKQTISEQLK